MSRFGLVGRHEKRQDAIGRLNRALGITIESSIHENSTPHCSARDELLTNSSKLGKLREILQDDIRFYEKFAA
jgi:hypothetical protein